MLGIAVYSEVNVGGVTPDFSRTLLLTTIVSGYLLSLGYSLFYYYFRNISLNVWVQSVGDVLSITALVHGTGGVYSLYSVFYTLVIIYAVTFLGRRGGILIASASSFLYTLFAVMEYYGVVIPSFSLSFSYYRSDAGHVLARIVTHVISFYFTALLSIFVVDQEKKTRALLLERQDAFARLDTLYKNIIESVNVGIITVNPEGLIKSFNRAAAQITGLPYHDVENRRLSEIFPDFFAFLQQKKDERKFELLTHFEGVFHTNRGRTLNVGASLSMLRDPDGSAIGEIIILEDIAEIIEMRQSLEKSRRLAFTGEVAANLAHEIRNPLAAIGGSIQLLRQDTSSDDVNRRLFDIILRGKEQLEGFLKDFLLLAKPAPGICEEIDLGQTILDVCDSLRLVPDWREPVDLSVQLPDFPLVIHAGKTEVRQVLWNLMLNALQAMPDGGALCVTASRTQAEGQTDQVKITVSDTGCGIMDGDMHQIFDPFYTTRSAGTGLGLAVVSRIIENWQGELDVSANEGGGTRFAATFPLAVPCCRPIETEMLGKGVRHGENPCC
jgi:two-component system sensor histidine kinase PilS (NtrC family)